MTLAQEMPLKEGSIQFSSEKKNTTSTNSDFTGSIDLSAKTITFNVPMENFLFEKSKQKEHYNGEKGANIAKFSDASYEGVIISEEDLTKEGEYKVTVKGKLTVMGTTSDLEATGTIKVSADGIEGMSEFFLNRETFGITTNFASALDDDLKIVVSTKY